MVIIQNGSIVMLPNEMRNAYSSIASYIREVAKEHGLENVVVLGIKNDGLKMVRPIQSTYDRYGCGIPDLLDVGSVDNSLERDDHATNGMIISKGGIILPKDYYDINGKHIILVDSVMKTGRTAFAAINSVLAYGRPDSVRLAVILKRAGQELPISPDYVFFNYSKSDQSTLGGLDTELTLSGLDAKLEMDGMCLIAREPEAVIARKEPIITRKALEPVS